MKRRFEDTLEYNYNVDIIKNSENRLLTDAWDAMQRTVGGLSHSTWSNYKIRKQRYCRWRQEFDRLQSKVQSPISVYKSEVATNVI